jgi:hypothetical protein
LAFEVKKRHDALHMSVIYNAHITIRDIRDITVSLETNLIVAGLPKLDIGETQSHFDDRCPLLPPDLV